MADLSKAQRIFREAYALHQIYWAMGAPMDDIFIIMHAVSPVTGLRELGVMARQGAAQFVATCGPLGMTDDEFTAGWQEYTARINAADGPARVAAVEGTSCRSRAVEIMAAMAFKGFRHAGVSHAR